MPNMNVQQHSGRPKERNPQAVIDVEARKLATILSLISPFIHSVYCNLQS